MTRVVFHTATTLDGFLADDDDSLDWLFAVPGADEAENDFGAFLGTVAVMVMGSATYEWIQRFAGGERPDMWADTYGDRLCVVLTTREPAPLPGARLRFHAGAVAEIWPEIEAAAGGGVVWIVGGGDVAGQFADAGLLTEIRVSVAPATLGSGKPLLPRRLGADRLTLTGAGAAGQFAELAYAVAPPA